MPIFTNLPFSFFFVQSIFRDVRNPPKRAFYAEMFEHQLKDFRVNSRGFQQDFFERIERNAVLEKFAADGNV